MKHINENAPETETAPASKKAIIYSSPMSQRYSLYLVGEITDAIDYVDWFHLLRSANENDLVEIHINSEGGDANTAVELINAMEDSPATVVATVEGACMSAATLIFLSANAVDVKEHSSFMFHNYSGGVFGKGKEMLDAISHEQKWSETLLRSIYKDFLTEGEITDILNNKDLWMDSKEVLSRLQKKAKLMEKTIKKTK